MAKSLYESLGVSKNATQDEIKKAYRKLVREVHPDKNPGSEERFKEVQGAYDVLSDPEKRKQYDRVGSTNGRPAAASPGGTTTTSPTSTSATSSVDCSTAAVAPASRRNSSAASAATTSRSTFTSRSRTH